MVRYYYNKVSKWNFSESEVTSPNTVTTKASIYDCDLALLMEAGVFHMPSKLGCITEYSGFTALVGATPHTAGNIPFRIRTRPIFIQGFVIVTFTRVMVF
jgi:hypothetical protein